MPPPVLLALLAPDPPLLWRHIYQAGQLPPGPAPPPHPGRFSVFRALYPFV